MLCFDKEKPKICRITMAREVVFDIKYCDLFQLMVICLFRTHSLTLITFGCVIAAK